MLVIFSGCQFWQPVEDSTSTKTVERIEYRDTTIVVPGDNAELELLLAELIRQGEKTTTSGSSTVTVRYIPETKSIQAFSDCDSTEMKVRIENRLRETYEKEIKTLKPRRFWGLSFVEMLLLILVLVIVIITLVKFLK